MAKTRPSLTRPSVSRLSVRLKNKTFGTSSSKKNARCRPSNLDDVHADPTFLLFAGSFNMEERLFYRVIRSGGKQTKTWNSGMPPRLLIIFCFGIQYKKRKCLEVLSPSSCKRNVDKWFTFNPIYDILPFSNWRTFLKEKKDTFTRGSFYKDMRLILRP